MISVEEIEPQETPQEAAQEEDLPAPEPDGGAAHSAVVDGGASAEPALDIEDAPPEPKKRGRPKAAPKEKPAPKPQGRPRKVVVPEEPEEEVQHYVPPPTDEQLHEYVQPLLRLYATHLMRGREGMRAQYRNLFSRM